MNLKSLLVPVAAVVALAIPALGTAQTKVIHGRHGVTIIRPAVHPRRRVVVVHHHYRRHPRVIVVHHPYRHHHF